ncbi:MAG: ATP synthase F1 subunit gamma [Patescibacteria group bacterium]
MALKDIKAKIQATKRMNTVTRAMEAVSAVKMRKTQAQAFDGRAYARAALSVLTRLAGTRIVKEHTLGKDREVKRVALVIITSDRGLAGSLNSSVLKKAMEEIAPYKKEDVTVFAYGDKGEQHFSRRGFEVRESMQNKADTIEVETMQDLSESVVRGFIAGDYDKVVTVYSHFVSTFEQNPVVRRLLPLSLPAITEIVEGIVPARGKWASDISVEAPAHYTVEPEAETVLDLLLPRLVAVSLYHMLLESKASEHSARMVAMKNASDKSKEVARDLTRIYNKVRQAAITREVSEIVSGREALST